MQMAYGDVQKYEYALERGGEVRGLYHSFPTKKHMKRGSGVGDKMHIYEWSIFVVTAMYT